MLASQPLRYLSLPAAVALGVMLAVACGTDGPTSPDRLDPTFKKKDGSGGPALVKDDNGKGACTGRYTRIPATDGVNYDYTQLDKNDNGFVCQAVVG